MSRPIEVRKTYLADVQYLARLTKAIEIDIRFGEEDRRAALSNINQLRRLLHAALSKE